VVTFAQLRDAKLEPLSDAVTAWTQLVKKLETAEDDYRAKVLKPLRDSRWRGKTAMAALQVLIPFTQYFRVSATEASAIASVLHSGHGKFAAAQRKLKNAMESASGLRLNVREDGSIHLPPMDAADANRLKAQAGVIHGQLKQAVKEATDADNNISQALGKLGPEILDRPNAGLDAAKDAKMAAGLAGFDKNNIPPKGIDSPKEAANWWKSLPEEQRHLMMNAYPEKIGWLNGIPSEDRDEANRVSLNNRIAQLEEQKGMFNNAERKELKTLTALQSQLGRLDAAGKDAYLLGIDTKSPDGRAMVAIGNPDHAKHTGVVVPGMTNNLDNFGATVDRADRLSAQANQYAPGEVSTIAWLGYNAPDQVDGAGNADAAKGASALNQAVDGIRQAQSDAGLQNGHVTAVGHSYGSVVIGEAAKNGGLHVNDIAVAGSPGMHVNHASDLHVGDRHVWVEAARGDPVPEAGRSFHGGPGEPLQPTHYNRDGTYTTRIVPSDSQFGGNQMKTDTSGHSGYWHQGSQSLDNQAKVIAGRYNEVGLYRGGAPK
jgi:hypothetical protein